LSGPPLQSQAAAKVARVRLAMTLISVMFAGVDR
jgi:hypothetical protein